MTRLLLGLLLAAGPAFAGSQKTSLPNLNVGNIHVGNVSAPIGLPSIDLGLVNVPGVSAAPATKDVPGKFIAPLPTAPYVGRSLQAAGDLHPQRIQAAPPTSPIGGAASENSQTPIAPVDPGNKASIQVAAELTDLRRALTPDAPDSLAEATLDPLPGHVYHPSPEDWRDEVFYSVFLDRFAKGPGAKPTGDPAVGRSRHGGNLEGLTQRLDYVKASGATTIVLSPANVATPEPENYHGYGPIHFMAIDPHLGTLADFKKMVAEAHARGLRVIMDLVLNHSGPVFDYKDDWSWRGMDKPAKDIQWRDNGLRPIELRDERHYTRHGVIENWDSDEQARNGDFPPDFRHLRTDQPKTQDALIHIAKWWIKEADVDGFRLDAVRHINPGFLRRFRLEIKEYAASLGKNKFFLLGENSTGVDAYLGGNLALGLDSVYGYPEYRRVNRALHSSSPADDLHSSLEKSLHALGSAAGRVVRFIDNHDVYRFLRDGEPTGVLKVGLAFLLLSLGIPLIYYGTEQGFRQKSQNLDPENDADHPEPENRQDMFPEGLFKTESSAGDKFDETSETFLWTKKLAEVRAKHAALRRGDQFVRYAQGDRPGIYAFSRIFEGLEAVVAINTADAAQVAEVWVDAALHAPGSEFVDELDPAFTTTAVAQEGGGVKLIFPVSPRGTRVFLRKS